MRHVFIINPTAGKGKKQPLLIEQINSTAQKLKIDYKIYITKKPFEATEIAKRESETGDHVRFYACGGDGTVNEVANGCYRYSNTEMTAVPCGTGNDFIKNFGSYDDFIDIKAQINGEPTKVDLIDINNTICINSCSVGIDAVVASNVGKFKKLPIINGNIGYTLSLLYCFFTKINNKLEFVFDNDEMIKGTFLLALVANGRFYGGGYDGAPKAIVDDGLLDVIIVKSVSRFKILKLLSLYKAGRHLEDPSFKDIIIYRREKSILIKWDKLNPVNIDGECIDTDKMDIKIIKDAFNFSVPKKLG